MPARRTAAHHSATYLVATTLIIAAFVSATVLGCSHGTARAAETKTVVAAEAAR